MKMQVVNFLTTVCTGIYKDTKAPFRVRTAALLLRQPRREREHVAQQARVLWLHLGHRRDVLFRQHQEMDGCARMDVVKGKDLIVLVHLARGNLAGNDFAEKAVGVVHVNQIWFIKRR